MATHIALLRGVNVGGRNKIAMADLRQIVAALGHTNVVTYIQSGNVVFTARDAGGKAGEDGAAAMAGELAQAITRATGLRPGVVVLSRDELAQVIQDNPYPGEPNPKFVHAVFLPPDPGPEVAPKVAALVERVAADGSRDTATLIGRVLFLHTPDGFGRSKLSELLLARSNSPVPAGTARNWSTVSKLLDLCGA
ncbi:MAG TPA: DUF1697 domain-containing protein [Streptosporangiaceae bacterium]